MAPAPSSPRLPSPPPPAEIQISPNSPSGGSTVSPQAAQMEQTVLDANSHRRVHPGTKAADMAAGPPLLDSAFQLQEHLAALHYHHTASGTRALTRATALQLAQPPQGIDRTLWLYELCRFLISQCNSLIVGFLFDTPPCSASTCPEMRASEWQFLCAVHEQPKSCCAIDYSCHTLDWAANVVSDQKIFPSRFVVMNDSHSKNFGVKNLVNVFRRLHRIFAHAWFQHRSVFWTIEGQTGLYVFFKTVCDLYDLLPAENYKLPPEAEGLEAPPSEPETEKPPPAILKPPTQQREGSAEEDTLHPARTNTRRHIRSSPSTGSAVTTVLEADEEETDAVSNKMRNMHISAADDEPEMADVPVIVEQSVIGAAPPQDTSASKAGHDPADTGDALDAGQTVVEVVPEQEDPNDGSVQTDVPVVSSEEVAPIDAPASSRGTKEEEPKKSAPVSKEASEPSKQQDASVEKASGESGSEPTDKEPEPEEASASAPESEESK
ncbi:MOB kinase activator-like 4 [Tolypocladium ophioglossoides CBS 100239]|uniref:MOB kinase activator-like 4 n=1 Tax=Tolypocladium ophioglossoides (strain CBS 100239) TaxID=1163406 RepID=A0A0L0NGL3_TOLOC|nr:MOB kinase activator-like 4 [Tolypocladium ophioglossoides CBS 100239]